MPMSRKDFIAMAAAIKRATSRYAAGTPERKVAMEVVAALIPSMYEANSNFDKGRFLEACGIEREEL